MNFQIKNLAEWKERFPDGFSSIELEISGLCNAKCKYCPAGRESSRKKEFIPLDRYEGLLKKLQEYKMYSLNQTHFQVYCLGEPLLHPEFNEILKITNQCGVRTNLSTNASVLPEVNEKGLKAVSRVLISMPGFSQVSYDKIHGFNFVQIKKNILELKKRFKNIPFDMTYHIYQFNLNEIEDARRFCKTNDINFAPNYAVLMDKNECMRYVTNTMPYEVLKDISKELFLGILDEQIRISPRNYCDFRERFLSVTIEGDVRVCSQFYKKDIICGNLLTSDIDDLIQKRYENQIFCEQCIAAGLTLGKGYDCKVFPDYYFSLMRENQYLREFALCVTDKKRNVEEELALMHQVRAWENDHYSKNELDKLLEMLRIQEPSTQKLVDIIMKYGRFGGKTADILLALAKGGK